MNLFQIYLRLRYKGIYNEEKSSDGQFTGGYYTGVYILDGNEYHVNFDGKYIDDITIKTVTIQEGMYYDKPIKINWPFFETVATND